MNGSDILTFGKYKDRTIEYILVVDPKYLEWAIDNIQGFKLSKSVLRKLYINLSFEK